MATFGSCGAKVTLYNPTCQWGGSEGIAPWGRPKSLIYGIIGISISGSDIAGVTYRK